MRKRIARVLRRMANRMDPPLRPPYFVSPTATTTNADVQWSIPGRP